MVTLDFYVCTLYFGICQNVLDCQIEMNEEIEWEVSKICQCI